MSLSIGLYVPVHVGLPGNQLVDSLVKTGATVFIHVPCPLAPTIAKIRHTRYSFETKSFTQLPLLPGFLGGTGPSPSHPL